MAQTLDTADLVRAVETFLYREARMLDERRWDDWLDLFTDDGMYWVPLVPGQTDPLNHASLFYEDALLREVRAKRLEEKRAWSQQPLTQSARIVGNIHLLPAPDGIDVQVASTWHVLDWNRRGTRMLGGLCTHSLRRHGDSFRIVLKRVDLVGCGDVQETLETFL